MDKYTSVELSETIKNSGCELESKYWWCLSNVTESGFELCIKNELPRTHEVIPYYPAYDLLWDICVKYAKEFFGSFNHRNISYRVHNLLIDNEKQIAEDLIWKSCLFNPKNK